ncbi:MAG: hypothetical protein PWR30_224 [Candidatus Woesearchaeota archaeon]|nr:hypothetical protein [Candidatus Woesearchaeota archaeon]
MKGIILDAGPIISLSINNLLWLFEELKKTTSINFYITPAVKSEVFDRPITTKKFKIKAIQTLDLISEGIIELVECDNDFVKKTLQLANSCFYSKGENIKVAHLGEIEAICASIEHAISTLVIDESNMRLMIEDTEGLKKRLSSKLHAYIGEDKENIKKFKSLTSRINLIRSSELVGIAYEKGLFERWKDKNQENYIENIDESILDGILWGVKLAGCSITPAEIDELKEYLLKKNKERELA